MWLFVTVYAEEEKDKHLFGQIGWSVVGDPGVLDGRELMAPGEC